MGGTVASCLEPLLSDDPSTHNNPLSLRLVRCLVRYDRVHGNGRNRKYGCTTGYGGWTFPQVNFGGKPLGKGTLSTRLYALALHHSPDVSCACLCSYTVTGFSVSVWGGTCALWEFRVTMFGVTAVSPTCALSCRCGSCGSCTATSAVYPDGIADMTWGSHTVSPTTDSGLGCATSIEVVIYYDKFSVPFPPSPPLPPPTPPTPPAPPAPPPWRPLTSTGPCQVESDGSTECVSSANYPRDYGNNEQCVITGFIQTPIIVRRFNVHVRHMQRTYACPLTMLVPSLR